MAASMSIPAPSAGVAPPSGAVEVVSMLLVREPDEPRRPEDGHDRWNFMRSFTVSVRGFEISGLRNFACQRNRSYLGLATLRPIIKEMQ